MATKTRGEALCDLYAQYAAGDASLDALLTGVRSYVLRETASEDVSQIVTLRVWQYLDKYDPSKGSFAGWVRTIAHNSAAKWHRQGCDAMHRTAYREEDHLADLTPERDDIMSERMRQLIRECPVEAELISLIASGVSIKDVAQILGLKRSQADYAIQKVKKYFVLDRKKSV